MSARGITEDAHAEWLISNIPARYNTIWINEKLGDKYQQVPLTARAGQDGNDIEASSLMAPADTDDPPNMGGLTVYMSC